MANKKKYLDILNKRKKELIEFLDEYNKLCIEVASELVNGRYANLDIHIVQTRVQDVPDIMYGYYSEIDIKGKSQRLQDIFHKKDTIEGHERKIAQSGYGYNALKSTISLIFERDIKKNIVKSKKFAELVEKFDSYDFSPALLVPLSHLLFFEQISLVPQMYEGQHPSYLTALRSFLDHLSSLEFGLDKKAPHWVFHRLDYWMDESDFDMNALDLAHSVSDTL
jgi:hypothetical protein